MIAGIFLVPNATFFVELAVVLILVFIFQKYAVPWVNGMTEKRQEEIRASLEAADQARKDAAAAGDERQRLLDEARGQAREIVAAAQQTADKVREDATARGQAEYERIVGGASADLVLARQRAVDEATARMGEVVLDAATKVVGREIDADAHRDLVDEAIAALRHESERGADQTA